jgi:hypothetical protein
LEDSTTGLTVEDAVTVLGINFDVKELLAIGSNQVFPVVSQPTDPVTSLIDKDRLIVKNNDTDQDGVPDNPNQFDLVVDGISPDLVLSLDGGNNDLTLVPPQQQIARDGATVYGVPRHQFLFTHGEVRWQEQFNKWGEGAFLQDFVDQSTFVSTTNVSGSQFDYTFAASIIASLTGDAPNGPQVLIGTASATLEASLLEITRGSNFEFIAGSISGISAFNIVSISSASILFNTLSSSTINPATGQVIIRQRGITISNAMPDDLLMASAGGASPVNTTGDVPFTVETYLRMDNDDASSIVIVDTLEDFSGSAGGYRLRVAGCQIHFEIGGSATSGSDILTAVVSATNADMLDGEFHHIAGVFTRGITLSNSALTDLSVVEDGDRLVNVDNSSTAIIYDMEVVDTSNAIAWVKNISNSAAASGLFGFDGCAVLRIETLGADGSFTSLTAASGLVATSAMGDYIIAYASGVPGTRVSASALIFQNPTASVNLEMMTGLFGSTTATPKAYCDGISITREARYGGTFTPGRIQPQTVFFDRVDSLSSFTPLTTEPTPLDLNADQDTFDPAVRLIREYIGRDNLNFLWTHFTPRRNLVDPSKTNIIDMFIHTLGYQNQLEAWLDRDDPLEEKPEPPTSTDLKIAFGSFLDKAMLSDTVVLHPGIIKYLFGSRADSTLRAKFRVIKKAESLVADDHLRTLVLDVINEYFDITDWDFGRVFYFTDLAAAIHQSLPKDVQSVVLVPTEGSNRFGDLFQVIPGEDEILQTSAKGSDIEIIEDITRQNIRRTEI